MLPMLPGTADNSLIIMTLVSIVINFWLIHPCKDAQKRKANDTAHKALLFPTLSIFKCPSREKYCIAHGPSGSGRWSLWKTNNSESEQTQQMH